MIEQHTHRRDIPHVLFQALVVVLVFSGLYVASQANFLLFHVLAELFSIVIAFSMFMVTWNAQRFLENKALLLLGIAYLFVGVIDLLHTLTYRGMAIFPMPGANTATELWIAGRYLQAISLLIAPLFLTRNLNSRVVFAGYTLVTGVLLALIFPLNAFPDAFVEGAGITPFKLYSEYIIILLLVAALLLVWRSTGSLNPRVRALLSFSILATIISEAFFTLYVDVYDLSNLLGHFLKIVAFFLVYKAITETGLQRPFELLFQNLQQSREALRQERDFVSAILDTSNALLMVVDQEGCIVRFNRALEQVTGYRLDDVQGRFLWETELFSQHKNQLDRILEKMHNGGQSPYRYDSDIHARDQRVLRIAWSISRQIDPDTRGEYSIWTGIDVTERVQVEDELRYLSSHDTLTGLYNRAFFEAEMVRLAETDHFPASIVVVDVDGLKQVNDSMGHLAGDKLLQRAAHILRSAFRAEDVVARMGGDEFAVLLPDADEQVAGHGEKRVRAILAAHNQVNPNFPISISVGTSTAETGYMLMEIFKKADQAMYQEKLTHKSRAAAGGDGPGVAAA